MKIKNEVAETVEDWSPFVPFGSVQDMMLMGGYGVGALIDGKSCREQFPITEHEGPVVSAAVQLHDDDVRVVLHTATERTGEDFIFGEYWSDVEVGAYATLSAEDVGAGVEE